MKVKVSRIRHPLACFSGEINVEDERTSHAEEIKLAFDYSRSSMPRILPTFPNQPNKVIFLPRNP